MSAPPKSPPINLRTPPAMEGPKESTVSRLFIAPLTFISFLLSLALIDSRNHSIRTHSHSPAQPTTFLGHLKAFLHRCVYKRTSSSPYAYISESSTTTAVSPPKEKENEPWYWHTKQRKMMKAEFSDAYRIRNSVLVVLLAGVVMLAIGTVYVILGLVGWFKSAWTNSHNMGEQRDPIVYDEQFTAAQQNEL